MKRIAAGLVIIAVAAVMNGAPVVALIQSGKSEAWADPARLTRVRDMMAFVTMIVSGVGAGVGGLVVTIKKLREALSLHQEIASEMAAKKVIAAPVALHSIEQVITTHTNQLREQFLSRIEASDLSSDIARKKLIDAIWDLNKKVDTLSQTVMGILAESLRKGKD